MSRADPQDLRAADYVLGLMEPREAAFFERDMRHDPALASRVETWRRRAAGLDDEGPATPHERMRQLIEAGLRGDRSAGPDTVREGNSGDWRMRLLFAAGGAALAIAATLLWRFVAG